MIGVCPKRVIELDWRRNEMRRKENREAMNMNPEFSRGIEGLVMKSM